MENKSCYIGPEISEEQFVSEHMFIYQSKGTFSGYDGNIKFTLKSGDYCLVRKNNLARYNKQKVKGEYQKVVIIFDELFLRKFQEKYNPLINKFIEEEVFLALNKDQKVENFIHSLIPFYVGHGRINNSKSDLKREELLLILLQLQPELSSVFFNFGIPYKINLEEFMNKNYKFNASLERFAFLTGRSLSAFKRDFKQIFNETPNRWLVKKRLQQAYFLINNDRKKPNDIYVDLGFENLSHFSFAFKKRFGIPPNELFIKNSLEE